MMSKTFIKIESMQHLEISRRTGQKSAFQHSLFWRYATDFSKLMPTTHTSMASTFQCEYCQCFTFKICNKIHTKMYSPWVRVEYTSFFHCSCRQLVASFFYAVERREWTAYFCIISIVSTPKSLHSDILDDWQLSRCMNSCRVEQRSIMALGWAHMSGWPSTLLRNLFSTGRWFSSVSISFILTLFTITFLFYQRFDNVDWFQGHPTTVFFKISVQRSEYCLEFSITWGRLKNF